MARLEDVEFKERLFLKGYPFKHYSLVRRPGNKERHAFAQAAHRLYGCAGDNGGIEPARSGAV